MSVLISVIVPVYNVEQYLERCVDSIIKQTYSNLEIILVDDGSTDKSSMLCDEYALKDKRIKAFHKKQGGPSDARNFGVLNCNGEYVSFIDSDDYIAPSMLEKLLLSIEENEAQVSICSFCCLDDKGKEVSDMNEMSPLKDGVFTREEILSGLTKDGYWYYVTPCNKLYKKDLLIDSRFLYGRLHEDEFFIHHFLEKCSKISCVEERLYYYVRRKGSITQTKSAKREMDSIESFLDRLSFFWNRGSYQEAGDMMNFIVDDITLSYYDFKEKKEKEQVKKCINEAKRFYLKLRKKEVFSKKKNLKYFLFFYAKSVYVFLYNKKLNLNK